MASTIEALLTRLYGPETGQQTAEHLQALLARWQDRLPTVQREEQFSARDVVLITYGDSLRQPDTPPLATLHRFATERLRDLVSAIHILPFYPYSSDDGFSVMDFYAVDPALGDWSHVEALSDDFALMFDAVFNHASAQGDWFQRFLAREPGYENLFMTESPDTDLSQVTRPRATPLLTPFVRSDGETVHVWTTFSADQVDFDARDPLTVLRLLDVLFFYVSKGAQIIRLDAIAYLWKIVGTSSIHLPQTHDVIRLMRAALDEIAPHVILITETNVPHAENVSYFGSGTDEAQMVYNFTLPPLLFHTVLSGDARKLREWVNTLTTPSDRTTFFNFTASHDGIGVRPVEGILTDAELQALIAHVERTGGRVNYKKNSDGTQSPYELNVTYVDALAGIDAPQDVQLRRFVLSQAVGMALAGVPAIYIHSLLGSRNDIDGMLASGINRRINRAKLDYETIQAELADPHSFRAQVYGALAHLLRIRTAQPAFHPNAAQTALDVGSDGVFALLRTSDDQRILALYNVSDTLQTVGLTPYFEGVVQDLISGKRYNDTVSLEPYAVMWLTAEA